MTTHIGDVKMARIVQIGVGGWGKNHVRVLSQLGVLCAICDGNMQRSTEYGQKYSVNHYATVDELLDAGDEFDGAIVATPTATHMQIAQKLLDAGKHVFVEKPLTYRAEDGQILTRLAAKKRKILTCGYIERFNPAVSTVKGFVNQKKFGKMIMLEFHRENRIPTHIKDVGIIYDTSVHDIDTANWLFDDMPHMVFARAGKASDDGAYEDFASIMMGYSGDRIAIITSNWITPKRIRRFNAVCTDAIISSDFITQKITIDSADGTQTVHNDKQEPLLLELRSFLAAIDGDNEPVVKAEQAVNVTRIAEAALLSSQKGVPIYMDLR